MARRARLPPLAGPIPHAGGWGTPGAGVYRPPSASVSDYQGLARVAIRYGEGTRTGLVGAGGAAKLSAGPDGLNTWYCTYAAISSTTGAADPSTAAVNVGPIGAGLVPGGQSYAGGGDSVGLGGQVLRAGDFVTVTWSGANPGDTVFLTVFGSQDIPV